MSDTNVTSAPAARAPATPILIGTYAIAIQDTYIASSMMTWLNRLPAG